METRYQNDLDKWKSRAQESELRKDILEKENNRLIEELNFWKTKNYTAEREKVNIFKNIHSLTLLFMIISVHTLLPTTISF